MCGLCRFAREFGCLMERRSSRENVHDFASEVERIGLGGFLGLAGIAPANLTMASSYRDDAGVVATAPGSPWASRWRWADCGRGGAELQVKITESANETFGTWREGRLNDLVLAIACAAWVAENAPTSLLGMWAGPDAYSGVSCAAIEDRA